MLGCDSSAHEKVAARTDLSCRAKRMAAYRLARRTADCHDCPTKSDIQGRFIEARSNGSFSDCRPALCTTTSRAQSGRFTTRNAQIVPRSDWSLGAQGQTLENAADSGSGRLISNSSRKNDFGLVPRRCKCCLVDLAHAGEEAVDVPQQKNPSGLAMRIEVRVAGPAVA